MILDRFRRPAAPSGALPEVREGTNSRLADALVSRLLETGLAESLIDGVVQTLMRGPMLEQLTAKLLRDLQTNPAIDALVDRQVERVLPALRHNEALRLLIQEQAETYLNYLQRHPEPVQRLIQQESTGVLREFRDALRERALAGDDRVEAWVRRRPLGSA